MRWVNPKLLPDLLSFVQNNPHSDFYDKKYAGLESAVENFSKLPLLTRAELVETPLAQRTFVPQKEVRFVGFTSGTSAQKPLITLFSDVEDYHVEPSLGIDIVRPLIIYPPLNKNFGHTFVQQCRQAKKPVSPMFADFQNLANSALIAKETGCDAIYATPTIATLFAEHARTQGIAEHFKLLALSSETLTEARRADLVRLYPNAKIANLYASSEIGQFVLTPCERMIERGGSSFHILAEALAAVELIDGELVVSYGLNRAMPLVRYQTGDRFEEVAEGCSCGRQGPVLRWSHRAEVDRVRLSGVEFDVEEADRVFGRLSRPSARYQVHFKENSGGGIDIVVEIEDKETLRAGQAPVVERALRSELLDLWRISSGAVMRDALARGLFASLTVMIVPAVSVSGTKARRFINHVR